MGETRLVHRLAALTVAVSALGGLTGCTHGEDRQLDRDNAWSDRMSAALTDEDGGQGGGSGDAPGTTFQMSTPSGTWDVLVACTGADSVRFQAGVGNGARTGSATDVLATTDVPCGVVGRMTIDYDASGVDPDSGSNTGALVLHAGHVEGGRHAQWFATVVRHGFVPDILKG